MEILIGADPEVFVRNKQTNELVSAHGLIPGSKENPYPVPLGAVQVDGMALEFNIDPARTREEFITNIKSVYTELGKMVPDFALGIQPVAFFSQSVMDSSPEEALMLGCDPDFNGWTLQQNIMPEAKSSMRSAAGHIHIGWTNDAQPFSIEHFELAATVARQLDYYLGVYSLLWDKDNRRRSLYGKAGAFRPKKYGMEYRVLSNVWLSDDSLMGWVYDSAYKGVTDLFNGLDMTEKYGSLAKDIIDSNNTKWVKNILHGSYFSEVGNPPLISLHKAA